MTTQELIDLLESAKIGGISKKPREISVNINGKVFMPDPKITIVGTGDGLCGAEITLALTGEEWPEETLDSISRR